MNRLSLDFYTRNVLTVAPELLGKSLVRVFDDGSKIVTTITEVEAYLGEQDLASHAAKGRTPRTDVMFHQGGAVYVYLVYGMYWMLNVVTGPAEDAQAVLIRAVESINGPGRLGRALMLDKSFYNESLLTSSRIWIEDAAICNDYICSPRVGVDYAGEIWSQKPYRFSLKNKPSK